MKLRDGVATVEMTLILPCHLSNLVTSHDCLALSTGSGSRDSITFGDRALEEHAQKGIDEMKDQGSGNQRSRESGSKQADTPVPDFPIPDSLTPDSLTPDPRRP
jgi:hypothetical protein